MIKVTVELYSAIDDHIELLGEAIIYNDGSSHTPSIGNYNALFGKKGKPVYWKRGEFAATNLFRAVHVSGFPRKRLLVWDLLYRALQGAVFERNGIQGTTISDTDRKVRSVT